MQRIICFVICFGLTKMAFAESERNVNLLASSCAACHGTNGHSVSVIPSLVGGDKQKFKIAMADFISGSKPATVMHQHSKGYTYKEIQLLAEFFSKQ